MLMGGWSRTYAALAAGPRSAANTALRRRLLMLSARLWWHPFWSGPGRMPAALPELRS
ncbi:hypothetical protein SAV31267_001430 [Streptomyces avermitilis]|uniref:Uncharacterized protein n=2 Tax=Streptomyces avermitilis TaxID=33903 RepID=A0A4D4MF98_STRAX|nr:hypothetical protein SAV31267_001430 [Streptomyces avermitilis]